MRNDRVQRTKVTTQADGVKLSKDGTASYDQLLVKLQRRILSEKSMVRSRLNEAESEFYKQHGQVPKHKMTAYHKLSKQMRYCKHLLSLWEVTL